MWTKHIASSRNKSLTNGRSACITTIIRTKYLYMYAHTEDMTCKSSPLFLGNITSNDDKGTQYTSYAGQ